MLKIAIAHSKSRLNCTHYKVSHKNKSALQDFIVCAFFIKLIKTLDVTHIYNFFRNSDIKNFEKIIFRKVEARKIINVGNGIKCEVDEAILKGITKEFGKQKIECDGGKKISPEDALKSFASTLHKRFSSYNTFVFDHAPAELKRTDSGVLALDTITEDEGVYKSRIKLFDTNDNLKTVTLHVDKGLPFPLYNAKEKQELKNWINNPTY